MEDITYYSLADAVQFMNSQGFPMSEQKLLDLDLFSHIEGDLYVLTSEWDEDFDYWADLKEKGLSQDESENKEPKRPQMVDVWVQVSGDYCAFHEMSINVVYDETNDIQMGSMTLDELEEWEHRGDYCDYELQDAILLDGKYYISVFH